MIGMGKIYNLWSGLTSISIEKVMVPLLYEMQAVPVHEESASVSGRLSQLIA